MNHHITWYDEGSGAGPLCEKCWQKLETPKRRVRYYEDMMRYWGKECPNNRNRLDYCCCQDCESRKKKLRAAVWEEK